MRSTSLSEGGTVGAVTSLSEGGTDGSRDFPIRAWSPEHAASMSDAQTVLAEDSLANELGRSRRDHPATRVTTGQRSSRPL